ncbi:MFS transporter [Amycolatopsis saalfeldensis]|uniref:MFS transporter, putative metabolite:H+ symporter n=1 Tax=Amycolatopsis saalfeldensis TaxID=394193 RepID=A0A1H8YJ22_9PSEU|nr:MFS transporter [Amycolatopsis saalfeldensis]SEP51418.1 MFS transporter, putative metabolite:H+ symporter [Amycolatopsis saalfeldensis]
MQIASRLDRLPVTRRHRYFVAVVGVVTFFDLYDLFLAATISTVLTKEFGVTADLLKPLIASAFVGAFVGAVFLGRLADRLGRRRAFLVTLGIYSVFTLLGAFSTDVWMLVACRFVAGIGIGAELPVADAYLADLLPARARGRATAWAYTIGFCGVPAAGFLARALVGHSPLGVDGWRWLFVIGALGAAIVWGLRFTLPESPRWLAARGREREADEIVRRLEASAPQPLAEPEPEPPAPEPVRVSALLRPPWFRRTAMLHVFQLLQAFGYYGFGSLVPIVLAAKGFSLVSSLTFSALTFLGYPIGSALSIPIIERIERKWLIVASAAGMAVFGLAFGYSTSGVLIAVFGFCYTAVSNVFSNAFHTYQGELFPTSLRATAAGSAYALSRLATAAMPFILLPVLQGAGATTMYAVVAGAMVLLIIDVAILGPRTTGESLETIAARTSGA